MGDTFSSPFLFLFSVSGRMVVNHPDTNAIKIALSIS